MKIAFAFAFFFCMSSLAFAAAMAFPGAEWERAAPESQGLDGAKLDQAAAWLEARSGSDGVRELAIVRRGRLVWAGPNIGKTHNIWSATKSFTSTVLGLLIDDGKATLDTRAADAVPALAGAYPSLALRHFATMTSGYRAEGDEPQGSYFHGPSDTPFLPFPEPLFSPPGSRYAYWDSAMNEFGYVLTRIAEEPIAALFKRRIADPIRMNPERWRWGVEARLDGLDINGGAGNHSAGLHISASEIARFGHLFLNEGLWDGRRLISREWVAMASRVQVPSDLPLERLSGADGRGVYGFNWWVNGIGAKGERKWPGAPERAFSASGYNNNDMFVVPEWEMVVVRLGLDQKEKAIDDATYGEFLRQIGEAIF